MSCYVFCDGTSGREDYGRFAYTTGESDYEVLTMESTFELVGSELDSTEGSTFPSLWDYEYYRGILHSASFRNAKASNAEHVDPSWL
ncbi:MAG: hypothetical protein ACRCZZ_04010 [Phocaeicola sp.]